jgi:hypothetical protein
MIGAAPVSGVAPSHSSDVSSLGVGAGADAGSGAGIGAVHRLGNRAAHFNEIVASTIMD